MKNFKPTGVRLRCKPCNRAMVFAGHSGIDITYRCRKCKTLACRDVTDEEKELIKEYNKCSFKEDMDIHRIYHAFIKQFNPTYPNRQWRYKGYTAIQMMDRFIRKHPSVVSMSVDDGYNAGSRLYLIPHRRPGYFWGTSVVYIPQCTGEDPIVFFLYEDHAKGLLSAMKNIIGNHRAARREARRTNVETL